MIEWVGRHLPVYKVQLMGETTKFRIFHRNLLFPLTMRNEGDEKQQNMDEKETKLTATEEENDVPSVDHVDDYKHPITRCRTNKMENVLLLKANDLMSSHFNDQ